VVYWTKNDGKKMTDKVEVKIVDGSYGVKVGKNGVNVKYNSKTLVSASTVDGISTTDDGKTTNGKTADVGLASVHHDGFKGFHLAPFDI
jgi:hypothetical protein